MFVFGLFALTSVQRDVTEVLRLKKEAAALQEEIKSMRLEAQELAAIRPALKRCELELREATRREQEWNKAKSVLEKQAALWTSKMVREIRIEY